MITKKDKAAIGAVIADILADAPKATILGEMASKEMPDIGKQSKPISAKKRSVKKLKELRGELKNYKAEIKLKSKNPLDPNIKEIAEIALSELCTYFRRDTGYNADWLKELVYSNSKSGRAIKHNYEQRIRCCQLIHFLISEGMTQRQAFTHADKIYGFNDTDAKETYPYFLENLKKYYFPEIKYKKYASILIFMDIIQNGVMFITPAKYRKVPTRTEKSKGIFENIFQNSIKLLNKEILYVQENNLEKIGIEINPIILHSINQEYSDVQKFILDIQRNKEIKWEFVFYTRQFIFDLDLYKSVKPK